MARAHRRLALSGIAAVVLLLFATVATSGARADANAPRWTAGDYWTYTRTSDNRTTRYDVVGAETVVLSQSYATFHLRKSVTTVSGGVSTTVTSDEWVRDGDLGLVKTEIFIVAANTLTYDPPLAQALFPLSAGKSWTVQSTQHWVWGFINLTSTVNGDAAVLSEGMLTVPAGNFNALAVRENGILNQLGGGVYSIQYYSEASGNWVKRDTYNANDQRTSEEVLTDYKCQACFSLPLVIVVGAILGAAAIIGLLLLRRRRAHGSDGSGSFQASPPR